MKKIVLIASATMLLMSSFAQAGLYRWVDESGEVHFSDKVPVAASKKAVSEINKHGIVQKTVDPEADALERLALEAGKAERERLVAHKAAEEQKGAAQRNRDAYLLSTYIDKSEITTAFINKIKLMKGNASIIDAQTIVLEKKLSALEKKHSVLKNKTLKESIEGKIVNITETIDQYQKALVQNKEERVILSKKYKIDVERYSELTK